MSGGEVVVAAARVYRDLLKPVVKTSLISQTLSRTSFGRTHTQSRISTLPATTLIFLIAFTLTRTEEMKRVLGKSAASVGLRLPEVYQP
ncbi:unnamed protein product [Eruca vesicaria subsp. sativa]|uniref:Uncharacterized protein n=1 Tax=Eruca vesicaria subsp. sativa TaxID=29727 RepID=A0ABC8L529_ERUVS|nr:unnamed protein product [Eruca vesicaria subsp. sativa]